jgi:methylated-DNA-[protein]-cysteine S-methyltransferase
MTKLYIATLLSPVGHVSLVEDDEAVLACGFYEHLDPLLDRLPEAKSATLEERLDGPAVKALRAYLDGDIDVFDSLSVRQPGSPFRQRVWNEMRKIRAGETISYSELARRAGSERAVRAAGTCCAINLIAPIVPCHRVLRSDGTLGGYGYGIETKRWLLAHEGITT